MGDNTNERNKFEESIKNCDLDDHLKIYHNKEELWPILKESNVFIRTSITDGDANSLREADYFNNVVIASDCISRPEFCNLYRTNDVNDLFHKIKNLKNLANLTKKESSLDNVNARKVENLLIKLIQ